MLFSQWIGLVWLTSSVSAAVPSMNRHSNAKEIHADIVIGGGSLAALAAAITAANVSRSRGLKVVLLEPTDWAGGQLTASNVPPDFGKENFVQDNLPASLVDLLMKVGGPSWESNPGNCWVSYKCFEALSAANYIREWLTKFAPNLEVYFNTVVKSAEMDPSTHRINRITAIRRSPKNSTDYGRSLSIDLLDWYTISDSEQFSKEVIKFLNFSVAIEATEFSDILVTAAAASADGHAALSVSQGVETPTEDSDFGDSRCGQSTVLPFYMAYADAEDDENNDDSEGESSVPSGSDGGLPYSMDGLSWAQVWTYRRAFTSQADSDYYSVGQGEQSNQNLDNDYPLGYIFLSADDIDNQISGADGWLGGINMTTLAASEQRSYGWYHYLVNSAGGDVAPYLRLNHTQVGTSHGLAKMPYLRDTRRVKRGLDGFRLLYAHLNYTNPEDNVTAMHFDDTIGIGVYHYADIHALQASSSTVCPAGYPSYITCCSHPVNPYYIPFRALTTAGVPNLLVAGKGMAQSFLANAATRLHPTEYSSGVAAGAAAVLMAVNNWSVRDTYANVGALQAVLVGPDVRSPLTWTL